jgi:hypothetical protein
MLHRPRSCPFCGLVPSPDYVSKEANCGTIYACPTCENIVYVVPQGTVCEHRGQVYCLQDASAPPPVSHTFDKVREAGARGPQVDVSTLFMGIVDGVALVIGTLGAGMVLLEESGTAAVTVSYSFCVAVLFNA